MHLVSGCTHTVLAHSSHRHPMVTHPLNPLPTWYLWPSLRLSCLLAGSAWGFLANAYGQLKHSRTGQEKESWSSSSQHPAPWAVSWGPATAPSTDPQSYQWPHYLFFEIHIILTPFLPYPIPLPLPPLPPVAGFEAPLSLRAEHRPGEPTPSLWPQQLAPAFAVTLSSHKELALCPCSTHAQRIENDTAAV